MLHELRVENLVLLEGAELRLGPGLNVLTGETGAGKTMLAQALDLLLGGRAGRGIVRRGAQEAYVEGAFAVPAGLDEASLERLPAGVDELVLARRVWPDGRTRAYICGRSATVGELRDLGARLLAFYGQHEHRKLMLASAQLDVLDAHCGAEQLALRAELARVHGRVRELETRAHDLGELRGARDRELDLLAFEVNEIEAADPREGEEHDLIVERDRLRNLESLRGAAAGGAEALSPEAGGGATEAFARAAGQLEGLAGIDPRLDALAARAQSICYEADELGADLRKYALDLEGGTDGEAGGPGRLEEVEERLALLARLERKHGGSLAAVLEHAERCRARRAELDGAEVAMDAVREQLDAAREQLDGLAARLRERRVDAAPRLAAEVRERLAELAMADAEFDVRLRALEDGCGPHGADAVELMIAPNPGVAARPLRDIASGGELSRVMLAVLSAAHGGAADNDAPLLVFDEVDAGIGGHTARAVGEHLRTLARGRQVLCITHLPQVASLAQRHFRIEKRVVGGRTETTVAQLAGDDIVAELVRMLGASSDDRAASQHARQLLRAA
jgi:DNA repair protein RecN (Recombination protein N)